MGLTPFGRFKDQSLSQLAGQAIAAALADAGVEPGEIEAAFVANSMASVTTGQVAVVGQAVLRPLGYGSIPVYNIDNACAASSSALDLAVQAIESGRARVVLVVGVEKLFGPERSDSYRALNGAVDTAFLAAAGVDATGGERVRGRHLPRAARAVPGEIRAAGPHAGRDRGQEPRPTRRSIPSPSTPRRSRWTTCSARGWWLSR